MTIQQRWHQPNQPPDGEVRTETLMPNLRGGRQQALAKLSQVHGVKYGETRNYLNGHVTHLSPYLRHGCITLYEAVINVRERFGMIAEKLLFEFGWREFWRTVWYAHGSHIMQDMDAPKVRLEFKPLPDDVLAASTGLPCMDGFIDDLAQTGYLHNHARMWLASYLVHWRKTDWKIAADWMHHQLVDGDYASNHLSWQWIASTFSHKPYFFNQENLAKYTQNRYCNGCQAKCPFNQSYSDLEQKLFKTTAQAARSVQPNQPKVPVRKSGQNTIIWIHDEILNPAHPLMQLPYEKVFIYDTEYYQDWSPIRLQFIADCLAEMPEVKVYQGNMAEVFEQLDTKTIFTQQTPNHLIQQQVLGFMVEWQPEVKVSQSPLTSKDITSFTRFWKVAKTDYLGAAL